MERRLLFTGPPGVAKTDLARALALVIAEHPLNVEFRMTGASGFGTRCCFAPPRRR